jgi:hypothetical protein
MKHIRLYENFQTRHQLDKNIKKLYIQELGKLVTRPYTFETQPAAWQSIVNDGEQPDYEDLTAVQRDKHFYFQHLIDEVKAKVWGTPQAAFNNFVGYAAGLGDDDGFPWEDMGTMSDKDYEMVFGQSDPEVIRMMRSLHANVDVFDWIDVK